MNYRFTCTVCNELLVNGRCPLCERQLYVKYNNQFSIDAAKIRGDDTVGNTDRLILRYQFEPKPGEQWTNTFKLVKKDDFIQVWITNGADKYAQYRLDKKQAKQLIEFLKCVAESS